jgi:(E)-4-hydroxy-3-methylbut-2-enyl-diphosphate synthase
LVADVHFNSEVADAAAQVVEAVRVNPGNYSKDASKLRERFVHLLDICKEHETAIRIGVNHGSLSERMMNQYGDTPEGMVASVMEFLHIAVEQNFKNIVISVKASNTRVMVETVRLLVKTMDKEHMAFPLHLGVTEAGEGEDGRIKSAVGIGALLADGIGDTIRVSLSEAPENEIPVAKDLVNYFADEESTRYDGSVTAEVLDNIGGNAEIRYSSLEEDWNLFCMQAAAECGRLLWDYKATELKLVNPNFSETKLNFLSKDILQAARVRIYKTEYISCPGCGRTMFDLQKTVAEVKKATAHLTGLKIAVMGCIVNGPGEMADADYGYVGAGRDRISLYRGKECVLKNIPQEEAVSQLLALIEADKNGK